MKHQNTSELPTEMLILIKTEATTETVAIWKLLLVRSLIGVRGNQKELNKITPPDFCTEHNVFDPETMFKME